MAYADYAVYTVCLYGQDLIQQPVFIMWLYNINFSTSALYLPINVLNVYICTYSMMCIFFVMIYVYIYIYVRPQGAMTHWSINLILILTSKDPLSMRDMRVQQPPQKHVMATQGGSESWKGGIQKLWQIYR